MKQIELSKGQIALVDDEDFSELSKWKWSFGSNGYAVRSVMRRVDGKVQQTRFRMHRQLLGLTTNDKREVDHINGNKLDNRRANLRICTHAENARNRGKSRVGSSGFKGVSYNRLAKRWVAKIMVNKKTINLGYFNDPSAAHEAYCRAANEHFGEFANHG